jgi:hypothetical protein
LENILIGVLQAEDMTGFLKKYEKFSCTVCGTVIEMKDVKKLLLRYNKRNDAKRKEHRFTGCFKNN